MQVMIYFIKLGMDQLIIKRLKTLQVIIIVTLDILREECVGSNNKIDKISESDNFIKFDKVSIWKKKKKC